MTATSAAGVLAQVPLDSNTIDQIVRAQVDSGFSGVVVVARGDSVVFRRAYGTSRVPLTPESSFWIGSMTKGFTAAAVLKLRDDGRLSIDDPLGKFLPDAPQEKKAVTIRQLLTHNEPGRGYRYDNEHYELLARVVQVASQQSWENYVRFELLAPAGLRHTGFWCDRANAGPVPVPSVDGTRSFCRDRDSASPNSDWSHRGANGMFSTAGDLLRWTWALDHGKVLKPSSARALSARQVYVRSEPPDSIYYGFGVRVYARAGRIVEVMHSGSSDDGHTSIARIFPSGTTLIVLSNAGQHDGTTWSSAVAQRLAARP
jgi:CubicO group peptidase (beta-lactamase class C family)